MIPVSEFHDINKKRGTRTVPPPLHKDKLEDASTSAAIAIAVIAEQ